MVYDHPPGSAFPVGTTLVTASATDAAGNRSQCRFEVRVACGGQVPGDCNQDRVVDLSDAVCLLGFLFLGTPETLPCGDGTGAHAGNRDLLDWNNDKNADLSDAVGLLAYLFQGGARHALGETCRTLGGGCPQVCNPAP